MLRPTKQAWGAEPAQQPPSASLTLRRKENRMPNLPGYTQKPAHRFGAARTKKQAFVIIQGVAYEKPPHIPKQRTFINTKRSTKELMERYSAERQSLQTSSSIGSFYGNRSQADLTHQPKWLTHAGKVLAFFAYFKEAVNEAGSYSYNENHRIRSCTIYYHLEDDSVEVVEDKTDNAGLPQGNLVKRHNIMVDGSTMMDLDYFHIGESVTIYGRTYHITGCNATTKKYLELEAGRDEISIEQHPSDLYVKNRAAFQTRETGCDFTISRAKRRSGMKKYMEASLGATVDNSGRKDFLTYGKRVLRLYCEWTDSTMFGDKNFYILHYFMADGSIEILERPQPNSGRDPFPKLMNRQKVHKTWRTDDAGGRHEEVDPNDFVSWEDLVLGSTINIYGRKLRLLGMDRSTRDFYEENGMPQASNAEPEEEREASTVVHRVPEYTGWGTQEDSLASCQSLVPKAPKTKFDIYGQRLSNRMFRAKGKFDPDTVCYQDAGREFIFEYFEANDTLRVFEPPQRNSGIIGGKFLSRGRYVNGVSGDKIRWEMFKVGALIKLNSMSFIITAVSAPVTAS